MTRAFVVDDSATMRRILRTHLAAFGVEVTGEADNGRAALAALETSDVDLLVLDWAMPELTGIDVLRAVRASERHRQLPVLMVTGNLDETDIRDAIAAGVSAYVVKPFDTATLAAKLRAIVPVASAAS